MRTSLARIAAFTLLVATVLGCDLSQIAGPAVNRPEAQGGDEVTYTAGTVPARPADRVRIGTFNIQVFGEAKLSKPEVVEVLVDITRRFDVLAIQEVRTAKPELIDDFVRQVNATGMRYAYLLGPRLGRTSSKEQYLYVYDRDRIEVDRNACYTVEDPQDFLHREPLVARFKVITSDRARGFTFSLVNIHTDPDEVDQEVSVLDDVFRAVQRDGSGEDDIILLGDLNASPREFGELGQMPYLAWIVDGQPTNTRGTKCYDNLLFDRRATTEFTGAAGIIDLASEYRLTLDQALQVSDHLPVWAEFSAVEGGTTEMATAPPRFPQF